MLELILPNFLFHSIVECDGFWSGINLLEDVPFIWCDESKPIQRTNIRLNIELVECMFEPSNDPPYGKNSSPFAKFFTFISEDIACLDQLL
jgi:hypothetical protein